MCKSHKHTGSKVGQSLGCNVEKIDNNIVTKIPKGSTNEQVTTFIDKVKDLAKSIFG